MAKTYQVRVSPAAYEKVRKQAFERKSHIGEEASVLILRKQRMSSFRTDNVYPEDGTDTSLENDQ